MFVHYECTTLLSLPLIVEFRRYPFYKKVRLDFFVLPFWVKVQGLRMFSTQRMRLLKPW